MTDPKHTDTSRSVTTLTAPTLSVVGNFVPPNAVVFFDGGSVIRINRNGTLELGPKWADAGDAATAFFNELVSRVVPSWNARLEALETENERLRKRLEIDPSHPYDGIYARDETIRGLDAEVERLHGIIETAWFFASRLTLVAVGTTIIWSVLP